MQKHKKIWLFGVIAVLVLAALTTVISSKNRLLNMVGFGMPMETEYNMAWEMEMAGHQDRAIGSKMAIEPAIEPAMGGMMLPPYYGENEALEVENRLYDRSAYFSLIVDDVQMYLRSMREYVLSIDGVVLNDSYNQGDKWKAGTLYVKVPVEKFAEASDRAVEGVEAIYSSSSNSSDVTGSHVSQTDRLEDAKATLAQTQATLESTQILLNNAQEGSSEWRQYRSEVLQLENRVTSYQRQIKNYEQNIENIESQVEYATLDISAADTIRYYDPRAAVSLWDHFEQALASLGTSGYMIASFLIWVAVYSVIWLPVLFMYKWIRGMNKKKKQ